MVPHASEFVFFFFNDTATTEIYTLSLHDLFRSHQGGEAEHRFPLLCQLRHAMARPPTTRFHVAPSLPTMLHPLPQPRVVHIRTARALHPSGRGVYPTALEGLTEQLVPGLLQGPTR